MSRRQAVVLSAAIWGVLDDEDLISNGNYSYLMDLFSKNSSRYEFFAAAVEDFREKIIEEWVANHKIINFRDFVYKHEHSPDRYFLAKRDYIDRLIPRDKANYLAFKIAKILAVDHIAEEEGDDSGCWAILRSALGTES